MRFLRCAVLFVALALIPRGAGIHAQTFGKNKIQYKDFHWELISSPHFDVYYYEGGRELANRVVAIAERANIHLSRDLNHRLSKRVPILIYNSHNDFAQTNVTSELLDESTGGFTEVFKSRVVIPFTGSYEELRHVVVHELTHAFQYDILYGGGLEGIFSRSSYINVPLWMAEGQAEYESLQMEPGCEQFMRDGIIHDYIVPLTFEPNGYIVYKEGQSLMAYIVRRYGREKYAELLHRIRTFRSTDRALERTLGVPIQKLNDDWIKDLKRQYWPQIATLDDPERFARRLTDHGKDGSYLNTSPAISPDASKVAYLSDRKIYTDIYLMSAIDGRMLKHLVRGSRSSQFENIPSFRGSLSWSPDSKRIAFIAKAGDQDEIYIYDLLEDKVILELRFDFDALGYPVFSPDGKSLCFEGLENGRNDIYQVDLATRALKRLTNDDFDEKDLTFAPDGQLTFSSDRHFPILLPAVRMPGKSGTYGIYSMNVETGAIRELLFTGNEDTGPAWSPDGRRLGFISQRNHGQNLSIFTPADSSITQVTSVIGGIYSLSWSRVGDRLVFAALNNGGWDVFSSKDSLSSGGALAAIRREFPAAGFRFSDFSRPENLLPLPAVAAPTAAVKPDSALPRSAARDTSRATPAVSTMPMAADSSRTVAADSLRDAAAIRVGTPVAMLPPRSPSDTSLVPTIRRVQVTSADSLLAESSADSASRLQAEPYHRHFSADYLTGGFQYNSLLGFGGSTQLSVSDFLGDRRFFLATDLFSSALDETNFLALYNYLPRRTDYAFGVFHFKNYYFSRVTGLGEQFSEARYFSERNFGVVGQASYPFSKFRRLDFDLSLQVVKRDNLQYDSDGFLFQASDTTNLLAAPSLSLVHDNVLYSYFGPVDGSRWILSGTQAVPLGKESLSYTTISLDYRTYLHVGRGYSFAFRGLGIGSFGRDPQSFFLGGPSTLRGYDDLSNTNGSVSVLSGAKAALGTVEFRFPFITHLGLNAPLPISFFNIEGVLFADAGAAWNHGVRVFSNSGGSLHFVDPRASYGFGIRADVAYFLMHLDLAWPTQATLTNPQKKPKWHFSIGPEF